MDIYNNTQLANTAAETSDPCRFSEENCHDVSSECHLIAQTN